MATSTNRQRNNPATALDTKTIADMSALLTRIERSLKALKAGDGAEAG